MGYGRSPQGGPWGPGGWRREQAQQEWQRFLEEELYPMIGDARYKEGGKLKRHWDDFSDEHNRQVYWLMERRGFSKEDAEAQVRAREQKRAQAKARAGQPPPKLSGQALAEVADWRRSHPNATENDYMGWVGKRHPGWNKDSARHAFDITAAALNQRQPGVVERATGVADAFVSGAKAKGAQIGGWLSAVGHTAPPLGYHGAVNPVAMAEYQRTFDQRLKNASDALEWGQQTSEELRDRVTEQAPESPAGAVASQFSRELGEAAVEELLSLGIGKYVKSLRPVAAGLPGASHVTNWTTRKLGKQGAGVLGDALESGASSAMKQIAQGETDLGKVAQGAVAGGVARGVTGAVKPHLPERPGWDRVKDVAEDRVARPGIKRGVKALLDAAGNAARPSDRRDDAPSSLDYVTTAQGLHDWIAKVGPTRAAEELRQSGRTPLEIRAIMEDHSSFDYPEISEKKIDEVTRPRPSGGGYGLYGPPWRRPMVQ